MAEGSAEGAGAVSPFFGFFFLQAFAWVTPIVNDGPPPDTNLPLRITEILGLQFSRSAAVPEVVVFLPLPLSSGLPLPGGAFATANDAVTRPRQERASSSAMRFMFEGASWGVAVSSRRRI